MGATSRTLANTQFGSPRSTVCIWCRRSTVAWSLAQRPTPPSCTEQALDIDVIYVPVGQGSGLCANIAVRDLVGRRTEVVAVGAEGAPAYALSFQARRPVTTPEANTFVDGVATRVPDEDAVEAMVRGAARFVQVSDQATEQAMRYLWQTAHQMPEPAGAIALAGLLADTARSVGAVAATIMTGGNCDRELVQRVVSDVASEEWH